MTRSCAYRSPVLTSLLAALLIAAPGCGGDPADPADPGPDGPGPGGDGGPTLSDEILETATGCQGVFNPDQVLDYHLELAPGDFATVLADTSYSTYVQAQFRCADEPAITVGVRRKRSGGTMKVGLKIDMNEFVAGQRYFGLRKLSLENGVSEGSSDDTVDARTYFTEYLAWRLMVLSGAISGRAAFSRLFVNGELIGVYVNVEQVDKRFLKNRLGDDSGWLYKKSGGVRDGLKTHELDGLINPYEDFFCFWIKGGGSCAPPPAQELALTLPEKLDIDQMLRMGAGNAFIANTDAPLFKDNNYYFYDHAAGRVYIPWDLDTVMNNDLDVVTGGVGGQTDIYTQVLLAGWSADYLSILDEFLTTSLTLEVIDSEITRAVDVASGAFASDPFITGTMADAAASLGTYWAQRHPAVRARVDQALQQ